MEYILLLIVVFSVLLIGTLYRTHKAKKRLELKVKEAWGKIPQNQYELMDFNTFSQLFRSYDSQATHDVELTHILGDIFGNKHFEEHITDADITFDYRLKEGKSTTRNAIKLLKLMGFEDDIISSAEAAVANFEQSSQWPVVKNEE